jgi:cytochrome c peroxidase
MYKLLLLLLTSTALIAQMPPLEPPVDPVGNISNADKILLGKALYWDEQLSATKTVACASCHILAKGGTDPRANVANSNSSNPGFDGILNTADDVTGSPGVPKAAETGNYLYSDIYGYRSQVTGRRAPSSINAGYANELFFDGRAGGQFVDPITGDIILNSGAALESQVLAPPTNPVEMGHENRDWNHVVNAVKKASPLALSPQISTEMSDWINTQTYYQLFEKAFGNTEINAAKIAMAIASYERSLYSNQSPFDQMLATNDNTFLTIQERAGFQLFLSQGCNTCHSTALFSDENFYNIGVTPNAEDQGRFVVTGNELDKGKFKTTSLRNLQFRTSFMHNGRFSTLAEVVDFYDRGGDYANPNKDVRIQPLFLSETQKSSLVAFLGHALTDPRVTAETGPFARPQLYTESDRVPMVMMGTGVAGTGEKVPMLTAVEPALLGNKNFTIAVENAKLGSQAIFVGSTVIPGTDVLPNQADSLIYQTTTLVGTDDGHASISVELPYDESMLGSIIYARWYIEDPQAVNAYAISPLVMFTLFKPAYGQAGLIFSNSFE